MALYSGPGYVEYQGRVLRQAKDVEIKFDPQNKDVNTLLLGRAGHTPGPAMVTVSVTSAIPSADAGGLEVDWIAASAAQAEVELTYVCAGTRYRVRGDVRDASMKSSAEGEANTVSFTHHGKLLGTT